MWHKPKKNRPSSGGAAATALSGSGTEASVRQLIANGKYKVAVETAKEIHKARATAASEALLVDAYAARIQSLIDQNLAAEAKALRELVCERYPSARERLDGRNGSAGMGAGRLEELVRPLNDPELSAEGRAAIEAAIARETVDMAALAECACSSWRAGIDATRSNGARAGARRVGIPCRPWRGAPRKPPLAGSNTRHARLLPRDCAAPAWRTGARSARRVFAARASARAAAPTWSRSCG